MTASKPPAATRKLVLPGLTVLIAPFTVSTSITFCTMPQSLSSRWLHRFRLQIPRVELAGESGLPDHISVGMGWTETGHGGE